MILRGYIEDGETLVDAIARVAVLAGQNGFEGYEICCSKCQRYYGEDLSCYCTQRERKLYEQSLINDQRRKNL